MKEPHCPQCGTSFVRLTRHDSRSERVLSLISFYPFRCQLCTERFRVFWPGARGATQSFDRRQYKRLSATCPAVFMTDQPQEADMVTDISMGGCTLRTSTTLVKGAFLELQLKPSAQEPAIKIETAMACSIRKESIGIQFLEFEPPEKKRMTQFVHSLLLSQSSAGEAGPPN